MNALVDFSAVEFQQMRVAAKRGNGEALYWVTHALEHEIEATEAMPLEEWPDDSVVEYKRAARLGCGGKAAWRIAHHFGFDPLQEKTWYCRALTNLRRAVAQDDADAEAQLLLARLYHFGLKAKHRKWGKALQLYHRAAEQGHPHAQHDLAQFYRYGRCLPDKCPDRVKAVLWYAQGAWQEDEDCRNRMQAVLTEDATVWDQMEQRAAATNEDACYLSMMALAYCYAQGIHVARNATMANHWKQRAASSGKAIPSSWAPSPVPSVQTIGWNRQRLC